MVRVEQVLTRRSFLAGAAAAAAAGVLVRVPGAGAGVPGVPLWREAARRGLVYGTSTATWQISDAAYARLVAREAAIVWTEDDLLWYRLKPTPQSDLDFSYGDQIVAFAEQNGQLVFGGPGLVWDAGFGDGWTDHDIWGLSEPAARRLLFGTLESVVQHYRGRVAAWVVVNEVIDAYGPAGLRTDFPWYQTIGPEFIGESFHIAHDQDPNALLFLNEFGFEYDNQYGDKAVDKQRAVLRVLDRLLARNVPVHALGVEAHLEANLFGGFDPRGYRRFLREVAARGLKIAITELDVLDDGLPPNKTIRDRAVADIYRRYLDVALAEPAVIAALTFGLSDRYTWLQEDYPRDDGAPRRPLPFDDQLQPKPAYRALDAALDSAPRRELYWRIPRSGR
jgi:endo-1,4-beta-xylanase